MTEFKQIHYFLKIVSVGLLLVLTALTYHPAFSNLVVEGEGENPLSRLVEISAGIAFLITFDKHLYQQKFVRRYMSYLIIIAVIAMFLSAMKFSQLYVSNFRDILMAFIFYSIGYGLKGTNKALRNLIILYSIFVAFVTLMQVLVNIGGFVIVGQYISYGKNTLGVMCSSAIIAIALVVIGDNEIKKKKKIMYSALVLFIIILELTIRARGAMLSAILILVYSLYKQTKNSGKSIVLWRTIFLICFTFAIVAFVFPQLYQRAQTYIFDSFTLAREDDLSTGRGERNGFAFRFFLDNPLFGNLNVGSEFFKQYDVHNYLLRQISLFGLLCGAPTVILYISFFLNNIKNVRKSVVNYDSIGWFVMLVPLVVSLEEPTFPYAPGTGVILPFVLFGCSLYRLQHGYRQDTI